MSNRKRLSYLLYRDEDHCGIHVGGCGMGIRKRPDASEDHIFTRSFFKDREDNIKPSDYNKRWNCQPMHKECNGKRGGQIYGFPLFICSCHWLQIDRTREGHILVLHYQTDERNVTFQVTSEKNDFVFNNPSTGEFSAELGGSSEVEISGIWTMPELKSGKKGIVGPGQLGHAFPRIDPQEVDLFNRLELQRIKGGYSETIEKFNRRMNRMWVHFENC